MRGDTAGWHYDTMGACWHNMVGAWLEPCLGGWVIDWMSEGIDGWGRAFMGGAGMVA